MVRRTVPLGSLGFRAQDAPPKVEEDKQPAFQATPDWGLWIGDTFILFWMIHAILPLFPPQE